MSKIIDSKIAALAHWRTVALASLFLFGCAIQLFAEYKPEVAAAVCNPSVGEALSGLCAVAAPIHPYLVIVVFILLSMPWKSMIVNEAPE